MDFTLPRPWTDPENGVDHTVDGSPAGGPVSGLEAVRDALGSRYPERYRGLNYWAQAQAAAGQAAHPELQIIQEESSQISRWLELYGAAGRHEPWRTVLEANTDVSRTEEGLPVWTTCLRHVTYGGQVCVCTRAAEHELNGDESLEPFHMDVNAGVAWTGPDDVWLCKPPERWRDWWYTGSLDRRSAAVGAGAALLAVLVVLAGIFLP